MCNLKVYIKNLGFASNHTKAISLQWLVHLGFFGQLRGLSPLLWNLIHKWQLLEPSARGDPGTIKEILEEMEICVDNGTMCRENLQFIQRLIDAGHWGNLRRIPKKDPRKNPLMMIHGLPVLYEDWYRLAL